MESSDTEREFIRMAKNYIWDSISPMRNTLSDGISAMNFFMKRSEALFNILTNLFEKGLISKELIEFRDLINKNTILLEELVQEQKDYLEHIDKMLYWARKSKYF